MRLLQRCCFCYLLCTEVVSNVCDTQTWDLIKA